MMDLEVQKEQEIKNMVTRLICLILFCLREMQIHF